MSKYTIKELLANGSVQLTNNWNAGNYGISALWLAVGDGAAAVSAGPGGPIIFDGSNFYGWNGTALVQLDTSGGGGGVPAGTDGSIQYNNGGSFGGDPRLYWDDSTYKLAVTGNMRVTHALSSDSLELSDYYEMTGFPNSTDSIMLYDTDNYLFSLVAAPGVSAFDYYVHGRKFTVASASVTIPSAVAVYFIYFDIDGNLSASTDVWYIPDVATVSYVAGRPGSPVRLFGEERHGVTMDPFTHEYLHLTVNTRYHTGLTLSGNVGGNGNDDNAAIVSMANGSVFDEDLQLAIVHSDDVPTSGATSSSALPNQHGFQLEQFLTPSAYMPIFYLSGTNPGFLSFPSTQFPVAVTGTSRALFNTYDGNKWTLEEVSQGDWVAAWVFTTNNIYHPIIVVMGQREDTTLTNARDNNTLESLVFGDLPFQEFKLLYRLIFQTRDNYNNQVKSRLRDIQDLRNISNVPAGTYVATDHGALAGLINDDHPQYVHVNGSRPMLSGWNINQAVCASTISAESISANSYTVGTDTLQRYINDSVNTLLTAGPNIELTYNQGGGQLEISAAAGGAGGTPAGSDGQFQFNDGGSFGGAPTLTREGTYGYIGIGDASTAEFALHLKGDGSESQDSWIVSERTTNSNPPPYIITRKSRAGGIVQDNDYVGIFGAYAFDGSDWEQVGCMSFEIDGTPSDGDDMPGRIAFYTTPNGTGAWQKRMVINNLGNVGIGIDDPEWNLVIAAEDNPSVLNVNCYSDTAAHRSYLQFRRTRNTIDIPSAIQALDIIGKVSWVGHNGTTWLEGAGIECKPGSNWSGSNNGLDMSLFVIEDDAPATTHTMLFHNSGYLSINGGAVPKQKIDILNGAGSGAIVIGEHDDRTLTAGTIEFDGTTFRGYNGSAWHNMDTATGATTATQFITNATVINVPNDYATLQLALDWIESQYLLADVTVTIDDGTYENSNFIFSHPNYRWVTISGNRTTPTNVAFHHTAGFCFFIDGDTTVKGIYGISTSGSGTTYGILVNKRAALLRFEDSDIESTSVGVWVQNDGYLNATRVHSHEQISYAWFVQARGYVYGTNTSASNAGTGVFVNSAGVMRLHGTPYFSGNTADYNVTLNVQASDGGLATTT